MKLEEIGPEKAKGLNIRAISMSSFLRLFHEYLPVALKEMTMELVCQVLRAGIAMELYCQQGELLYHMFC